MDDLFKQTDEECLREDCVSSSEVFRGHFFAVSRDRVRQSDGSIHTREFIRHPGA
ncbi:MAG: ADP-ribose pyrophosphatase, partial [Actinobacteria bacterium]|nr:ADP-ribose pyrophosphatase [Actinomycetota bacterium]